MLQSWQNMRRLQTITPPHLQQVESEPQDGIIRLTGLSNANKACILSWSSTDYQSVEIPENSVIYCDIPYIGTATYVGDNGFFDYDRFYAWCLRQRQPLYISSYWMPEKDFKVVAEFPRRDTFSTNNKSKKVIEKIFMPRNQETRGTIQLSMF